MNATAALDALLVALMLFVLGLQVKTMVDMAALREVRGNLRGVSEKTDLLILALAEALPHLTVRRREGAAAAIDHFRDTLLRLLVPALRAEDARGNPLTRAEITRMWELRDIIATRIPTPEEAGEFQTLVERMHKDRPRDPDLGALAAGAILLGALAALFGAVAPVRGGHRQEPPTGPDPR